MKLSLIPCGASDVKGSAISHSPVFERRYFFTVVPTQGDFGLSCIAFFDGFVAAVTLASLFKGHQPRSPVPPPSSFPSGFKPVAAPSTNNRLELPDIQTQQRRRSRTDLDFEEALASPDTILLKETIDLFSPELDPSIFLTPPHGLSSHYGSSPSTSGKREGSNGSPSPNPRGRNITTPLRQPGTPNVIPATPTPPRHAPSSVLTSSSSSSSTPFVTPLSSPNPSQDGEDGPPSARVQQNPQFSNLGQFEGTHSSPYNSGEDENQIRRRSMYRSPGSASSPDLVTLLKRAKQRNGSSNAGSSGTCNRDTLRADASDGGSSGGVDSSSRRLRTTSATPSSNSVPQQGQRPRVDRIATSNSSSSSFHRGEDSSKFLSTRSPDWVLPSPSTSPAPSPSVMKVTFPLLSIKSERSCLIFP